MDYYALLSGEHPTIPRGELRGILEAEFNKNRILYDFEGVTLFSVENSVDAIRRIVERAGWVKEVGILYSVVEAEVGQILNAVRELPSILPDFSFTSIEIRKFKRYGDNVDEKRLKEQLKQLATTQRIGEKRILRIFITEGVAIIGRKMYELDTRSLYHRRPGKRPFFKPGPLSPNLTRAMINLSRLRQGEVFLDPFCGTGGFVIEACFIGAKNCLCGDLDYIMAKGSRINVEHYKLGQKCLVYIGDAGNIPIAPHSVDAIATDPPYGRSTSTKKMTYENIVSRFLESASETVKKGAYIVYAGPLKHAPSEIAIMLGFKVVERYEMHVHGTLTREIVVIRV